MNGFCTKMLSFRFDAIRFLYSCCVYMCVIEKAPRVGASAIGCNTFPIDSKCNCCIDSAASRGRKFIRICKMRHHTMDAPPLDFISAFEALDFIESHHRFHRFLVDCTTSTTATAPSRYRRRSRTHLRFTSSQVFFLSHSLFSFS